MILSVEVSVSLCFIGNNTLVVIEDNQGREGVSKSTTVQQWFELVNNNMFQHWRGQLLYVFWTA